MHTREGFFLAELCVAVALMCLLCTIGTHSVRFFDRLLTRMELEHIYTTIHTGRWHAINTGVPQKVVFNTTHNSYTSQGVIHTLPAQVVFGAPSQAKGPPAHPSALIKTPITFAHSTVTCFETGIISSGSIYLKDSHSLTAYALSNGVSHVSCLRCYHYKDGWHLVE